MTDKLLLSSSIGLSFEGSVHNRASLTFRMLWNKYKGRSTQAKYESLAESSYFIPKDVNVAVGCCSRSRNG